MLQNQFIQLQNIHPKDDNDPFFIIKQSTKNIQKGYNISASYESWNLSLIVILSV